MSALLLNNGSRCYCNVFTERLHGETWVPVDPPSASACGFDDEIGFSYAFDAFIPCKSRIEELLEVGTDFLATRIPKRTVYWHIACADLLSLILRKDRDNHSTRDTQRVSVQAQERLKLLNTVKITLLVFELHEVLMLLSNIISDPEAAKLQASDPDLSEQCLHFAQALSSLMRTYNLSPSHIHVIFLYQW
jgi:hypothetical protein